MLSVLYITAKKTTQLCYRTMVGIALQTGTIFLLQHVCLSRTCCVMRCTLARCQTTYDIWSEQPGISHGYVYYSGINTIFPCHTEDNHLASVTYCHQRLRLLCGHSDKRAASSAYCDKAIQCVIAILFTRFFQIAAKLFK